MKNQEKTPPINHPMDNHTMPLTTTYTALPNTLYQHIQPTPVTSPTLTLYNTSLAKTLGLTIPKKEANDLLSGKKIITNSTPIAQAYAGYQFGHFVPQLGDGRAILLGEIITPDNKRMDIQLKGSGKTTYSRQGDGRSPLGAVIREYLVSEAMHALGIPTTRSLAIVSTGETVQRQVEEPGGILTRVASSHIRIGTFNFLAARNDTESLEKLTEYTINRHYPTLKNAPNQALALLEAILNKQASLIAKWMHVGFIHGVMNTDNTTLSGETIDYGPCAFMEAYHPDTVFSSIDHHGRYAYKNQPGIVCWNLERLTNY